MPKSKKETESKENKASVNANFDKKYGYIHKGSDSLFHTNWIKTPIESLNAVLGGGIPSGKIIELYGNNATGKTTFTLQLISQLQQEKPDANVVYIDMENTFNGDRATSLGVDISKIWVMNAFSGEKAFEFVVNLIKNDAIDFVAFDSVAAMISEPDAESDSFSGRIGGQARMMSLGLQKLNSYLVMSEKPVTLVFLNQIRNKVNTMGYGSPETTSGGVALGFYAAQRIKLTNIGMMKSSSGEVNGQQIKFTIIKNRFAKPNRSVNIALIYNKGFDPFYDLIIVLLENGTITKRGAWLYYQEQTLGNGVEKAIETISSSQELTKELMSIYIKDAINEEA